MRWRDVTVFASSICNEVNPFRIELFPRAQKNIWGEVGDWMERPVDYGRISVVRTDTRMFLKKFHVGV